MRLKMVDLPAPFGPMSPVMVPRSTSKVAWSVATRPPKRFCRSFTRRTTFSFSMSAPSWRSRMDISPSLIGITPCLPDTDVRAFGHLVDGARPDEFALWWEHPLRPEAHQDHDDDTDEQQ